MMRLSGTLGLVAALALACSSSSPPSNPGPDAASPDEGTAPDTSAPPQDASSGGGDTSTGPGETGAPEDTWTNFAKDFMKTYCVECHNASTPYTKQDFTAYADVVGLDSTIRCGTAPAGQVQSGCPKTGFPPPGQFPITDSKGTNPKPTDPERLRLIAWINAGAPQ